MSVSDGGLARFYTASFPEIEGGAGAKKRPGRSAYHSLIAGCPQARPVALANRTNRPMSRLCPQVWICVAGVVNWPNSPRRTKRGIASGCRALNAPWGHQVLVTLTPMAYPCPACGSVVFDEPPGSFDICPVCGWEDDNVQLRWPDYAGGANERSLIDHQTNRPTRADYPRDPDWRPVDRDVDSFEAIDVAESDWPEDPTVLYYWRPTFWRAGRTGRS